MTARKVVVLPMVLLFAVALLVISEHARVSHQADAWSAMRVLDQIKSAHNGGDDKCVTLEIAFCPKAVNSITGRRQPHAKVFCELPKTGTQRLYAVGIFGLAGDNGPVYVTGYAMTAARRAKVITRDQCAIANVSYLNTLLR